MNYILYHFYCYSVNWMQQKWGRWQSYKFMSEVIADVLLIHAPCTKQYKQKVLEDIAPFRPQN